MKCSKLVIWMVMFLVCSIYVTASSSINYLTKGFADTLYCRWFGDCELNTLSVGNLSVYGTYFNVTVENYNVTGTLTASGNVTADYFFGDGSYLTGIGANGSIWNITDTNIYPSTLTNNVGIGIIPATKLTIKQSADSVASGFRILASGSTDAGNIWMNSDDMIIQKGGNTNQLVLESGGNVGIGTTSPETRLHLVGTTNQNVRIQINGTDYNSNVGLRLCNDASCWLMQNQGALSDGLLFYNGGYRMIIDSDGDVGIGTTTPKSILHVYDGGTPYAVDGNTAFLVQRSGTANSLCRMSLTAGNTGASYLDFGDTDSQYVSGIRAEHSDNTMVLRVGGSDVMYIKDGNVGIGIDDPTSSIHAVGNANVTGNIYANRVYTYEDVPHMFGLANQAFTLTSVDTWYNITFNASISMVGGNITFVDNKTLIIQEAGDYLIDFGVHIVDSSAAPSANVAVRIAKNDAQLLGSYAETYTARQNAVQYLSHLTYAELEVGDMLQMQVISSDDTVSVDGLHTYDTGQQIVATGYIERID